MCELLRQNGQRYLLGSDDVGVSAERGSNLQWLCTDNLTLPTSSLKTQQVLLLLCDSWQLRSKLNPSRLPDGRAEVI